ncbi:MAG: flagellar hook-basal body complex protein [Lachnospiraceae bacterium]|nr:flagellar hook-basal body complex protein [Lachnospiraceae bacterium]
MMRSLFSGVAGLKTHQTRMDVIGNNIANVNTTAYKSQSMVFNDLLYQTTQAASGANATTGRGGINPRQIGLGAKTGAISTAITTQGSAQSTNNPWDVMIEGDSFFVVSDGSQNFFTRDGSFTVDGAGNLVMASLGYTVMGWQVDPQTGDIRSDVVSALQIMNADNLTAPPEATTRAYLSGILDKTDPSINSDAGAVRTFTIYDAQGYSYMVKMSFHGIGDDDRFRVQLDDILDGTGVSLVTKYGLENINQIATFGANGDSQKTSVYTMDKDATFNGTDTFNVTLAFSEILEGYANNALVVAAGDNVEVTVPADGGTVTAGQANGVTVKGTVTLTKEQLQSEPYNLIYNEEDGKYYQKPASGATLGEEVTDLATYLSGIGALSGVKNVTATPTQNGEAGQYDISFEADFTPTMNATRTGSSFGLALQMPNDEKDILKYVYNLEDSESKDYKISYIAPNGTAQITETEHTRGMELIFDHDTGKFSGIGGVGVDTATLTFNASTSSISGEIIDLSQFSNVDIDFSSVNNFGNGKKCTLEFTPGSKDSTAIGKGRKIGELIGVEIGQDGKITASYDNGLTKLLGQIAVAEFANASGLSKAGNNLYSATQNSGEFDGVGKDITASGGSMTSGVLEMSNVDLSSEFTTMITTQRGFQANSRIITTSDTLLEELVNLKR